jgi:RHS repeat-associated protein
LVLTYNQNNRLISVEEDSVTLGEYTYNGLGQRIIKEVDGVTTVFHYDFDGNIIAESDESGNFDKEYLYRGSSRLALVDVETGELYYYGNDRLGTPQILTDSTNTVVWEAVYDPFGEADINPNSTVVNNFRFPGQYYDSETGLHYNYHRYYDPNTGRYLTPDPIGMVGGKNLFTYVYNNPINYSDPNGLCMGGIRVWFYLNAYAINEKLIWLIDQVKDGSMGITDLGAALGKELYCETKDIQIPTNEIMWLINNTLDDIADYTEDYFREDFPKDFKAYMDWWYPKPQHKESELHYTKPSR